jgi:hypothetical protein
MLKIRTWAAIAAAVLLLGPNAWASAQADLGAALEQGHSVFVVVTQSNARGTDRAVEIARQAQALSPGTDVVLLDRALAENAPLVESFRVLAAPVPLVLVVARNGVVAGGALLEDATPQVLVKLIPTPRKAEMLLGLSRQTPVFIVFSRKTMAGQSAVYEALTEATRLLEHKVTTVVVDMDDRAEAAYLAEMGVKADETAPVTVVYNAKAQKTGALRGLVTPAVLVETARKQASCCPGGSC